MHPQLAKALNNRNERWRPLPLWLLPHSLPTARDPAHILEVVAALQPEASPRYAPLGTLTYCNIFLWDFTCAMGAEVPHWVDAADAPAQPGRLARETRANELVRAMRRPEGAWGYTRVDRATAAAHASAGRPVVAGWVNELGPGHVGVVLPGNTADQLRIAQAGARCARDMSMAEGFGQRPVQFFSHP
jgi:hypothetical protein